MSRWGFTIQLDSLVAVKARELSASEFNINRLQGQAKEIAKRCGLKNFGLIENPYHFVEDSFLLHFVTAPGNACDLGLDEFCRDNLSPKERFEEFKKEAGTAFFIFNKIPLRGIHTNKNMEKRT
ncbi:MAG: hypothetical protein AABW51_03870 [Nanoarchaeota archaeon]